MIPEFNTSMVLPPFFGDDPCGRLQKSPYIAGMKELVEYFAFNGHRARLLAGLLKYRRALRSAGLTEGFQWLDGSFIERVEQAENRPPNDIDLVTFAKIPNVRQAWIEANSELILTEFTRYDFCCDAYFVDLERLPEFLCKDITYWFGLFSHQRDTLKWKGLLQIPLFSDDEAACVYLARQWPQYGEEILC